MAQIELPAEKMVQLRMWAVDTVAREADYFTDVNDVVESADALVKFVLGES